MYEHNNPFVKLNNKPLLFYTLNEITKSKSITNTIISTDDQKVSDYVKKHFKNFRVHLRKISDNVNLSNNKIIQDVIKEKKIKKKYDIFCMLYISTPLRKSKHIDYSISMMNIFNTDKLVSVSEELSQLYRHDINGLQKINDVSHIIRFERDSIYRENGSIYLYKKNKIKENIENLKIGHIKMLQEESIKINSKIDLILAEQVMKGLNK